MTCREFIEFLLDYHEERLPAEERARFDAHLGVCPDCRTYLETYVKTVDLTKVSDDAPVPEEAPDDLIEAILRSRQR